MRLRNLKVVEGDFLRVSPEDLRHELAGTAGPVRAVGNLPYYAASPILFRLIALQPHDVRLAEAIVMLQREVGSRLTAVPGYSRLRSVDAPCRLFCRGRAVVPAATGCFSTRAEGSLRARAPALPSARPAGKESAIFAGLIRAAFNQRRKTLANAIKPFAAAAKVPLPELLAKAGLDPRRRPETLALAEWIRLADIFAEDFGAARLVTPTGAVL